MKRLTTGGAEVAGVRRGREGAPPPPVLPNRRAHALLRTSCPPPVFGVGACKYMLIACMPLG